MDTQREGEIGKQGEKREKEEIHKERNGRMIENETRVELEGN